MNDREIEEAQGHRTSDQSELAQSSLMSRMEAMYGDKFDKFQDHLMEQYKLCVEMSDRVSARRGQIGNFYISLSSALLTLLSLAMDKQVFGELQSTATFCISTLGLALCSVWYINIQSYRQLNSLKFQIIQEMEQYLPFRSFTREWEIFQERKKDRKQHTRLTTVEKFIPLIFSIPYFGLLIYSFLILLGSLI